jgi:hypothetical protein
MRAVIKYYICGGGGDKTIMYIDVISSARTGTGESKRKRLLGYVSSLEKVF